MGGNVPKALIPISDNEPCLTTTLKQIGHKFKNVFIVVNVDIADAWEKYLYDQVDYYEYPLKYIENVTLLPIKSGLGDGHAVLAAINKALDVKKPFKNVVLSDDVVVCWGDVFFPQAEIIDELLSRDLRFGLIPAVKEENPYVTLLVDMNMKCISADFSKYGESHLTGFHDQSVFRFDKSFLRHALITLHQAYWKNGRYITPGGELSLLHTFHFLHNSGTGATVFETDYPTLSFNTIDEVSAIQQEINQKWQKQNQS